jgi:UDP-glucose 4-epimerase
MKILLTGGAGFIGSAIVPFLQKSGKEIFVYDNLSFGKRDFIDVDDKHFIHGDIRDKVKVNDEFKRIQPDIIVHLAAIHFIPYCNEHPFEAAEVNIRGAMNVLAAARQIKGLKEFIFASTAAVYPVYDEAIGEELEVMPLDIYGLSKVTGEELCIKYQLESGVPTIACRFFNAFGPNETNPHLIPEIERQLRNGSRTISLGNLSPRRDFIHTHDMAAAIGKLIEKQDEGYRVYNLARGIEYSVTDVVRAFETELGEKITIEQDPARIRKVEREHLLADISKLKNDTGWFPRYSLEDGIRDLINNWK